MTTLHPRAEAILTFWFGPADSPKREKHQERWFKVDPTFDMACRSLFAEDQAKAARGEYDDWADTPEGALALLLLLDQIPRNLYRGTAAAFSSDMKARDVARRAIAQDFDRKVPPIWRWFFYLPLEHSEDMADQTHSLMLFEALPPSPESAEAIDYARRHRDIIARFGRFPHRNAILGRESTPEEIEFLKQPNSSF